MLVVGHFEVLLKLGPSPLKWGEFTLVPCCIGEDTRFSKTIRVIACEGETTTFSDTLPEPF